jgi:hypothetical protein
VVLYLAGEGPIDGATTLVNSLVTHMLRDFNGIGIILENRYYGESVPYNTSTTDQLRFLTTEQVLADFELFARKVELPGVASANAPDTPWLLFGGSYSGALVAFTMKTYGRTFWGGIASSGVIHAQVGYPEWYDPIQLLAPQDCVASINNIVDKMDLLVRKKNWAAMKQLKELFGLSALKDIRDFAQTIAFPLGGPFLYPTYTWQEIHWNPSRGREDFFHFCRNVTDIDAPANTTAVDYALSRYTGGKPWKNLGNYASYIKRVVLPLCPDGDYNSRACFGTQHPETWADTSNNYIRSWLYTSCIEFGAYQVAQPWGKKSLVSRVLDAEYTQQWCRWAFPKGKYSAIPEWPDVDSWNSYGDFDVQADRLLYIDGSADPWGDLCHHSKYAPKRYWSDDHPEHLINGGGHCWDIRALPNITAEPQFIRETNWLELRTVKRWLREFEK